MTGGKLQICGWLFLNPCILCLRCVYFLIDESQSTSPDDGGIEASPRINRFLARLPPDGCEKVRTNLRFRKSHMSYHSYFIYFDPICVYPQKLYL